MDSSTPDRPESESAAEEKPARIAVPQMPTRPEPPSEAGGKQRGCMSIVLASLSGVFLLALLMTLLLPFGKIAQVVVAIVGGVFLVAFLHYITWGWWLGRLIQREDDDDDGE
jgi:hypothetical protein